MTPHGWTIVQRPNDALAKWVVEPATDAGLERNGGFVVALCCGKQAEENAKAVAALPELVAAIKLAAPHGRKLQHGPNVSISAAAYRALCDALEKAGLL